MKVIPAVSIFELLQLEQGMVSEIQNLFNKKFKGLIAQMYIKKVHEKKEFYPKKIRQKKIINKIDEKKFNEKTPKNVRFTESDRISTAGQLC